MKFISTRILVLTIVLWSFECNAQHFSFPEFPYTLTNPGIFESGEPWLNQYHTNNPATLPFLKGMRFGVLASETLKGNYTRWDLSGESVFFAMPIPYIFMGFGAGLDVLRAAEWIGSRMSLGFGSATNEMFSWGLRYSRIIAPAHSDFSDIGDFSISARLAVTPSLVFSWQMDNALMSLKRSVPMDRIHRLEGSWGKNWKVWGGLNISERRFDYGLYAGIRLKLIDGVFIWGNLTWSKIIRDAWYYNDEIQYDIPPAFSATLGLSLVVDNMSMSVGGGGPNPHGTTSVIWDEKPQYESVVPSSDYAIMVDFSREIKEKDYVILLSSVKNCLRNDSCSYMILKVEESDIPLPRVEEFSRLIDEFKKKKKKVLVYSFGFSNTSYAISAGADKIMMFPGASINLKGLSFSRYFAGDALKKVGVEYQFVRFGPYKSAVETYTRNSPTKENIKNMSDLLKGVDRRFKLMLSKRKGFSPKKINAIFGKATLTSTEALQHKLIDYIIYPDQIMAASISITGKIATLRNAAAFIPEKLSGNGIGLLVMEGEIVNKSSSLPSFLEKSETIEVSKVISALNVAVTNPNIKAVVIRINSPGGGAMASEILWRRILILNKLKPVVVSFGEYATSGGYYIASGAGTIFSEGSSITGSIGIYGGKYNIKSLIDKLGVGIFSIKRAPFADMDSKFRPYTPDELGILQKRLKHGYTTFLRAVSSGRKIKLSDLDSLAQGRVFSGEYAKKVKLVDELGGVWDAINFARRKVNLTSKSPVRLLYPPPPPIWKKIVKMTLGESVPVGKTNPLKISGKILSPSLFEPGPWYIMLNRSKIR
ncbi:MAG: signal peptide peptidase SppA [Deltaproteobacteria bacterium]|nr:signal peptide peptidase SppA [Deltaproteobacteria bacterium]